MKFYYRISDNSYEKNKLPGATKEVCLDNFLRIFGSKGKIIADNCSKELLEVVESKNIDFVETNKGNAGAIKYALELAMEECDDDEIIYFVEDDYLHQHKSSRLLKEGMDHSDYLTLYDHPDKYTNMYDFGEFSKVIKTESSHWRYSLSTCMTFATKVKNLKEDFKVWEKYTSGDHPFDHLIFSELALRDRKLVVCIPGVACHVDLTFSISAKTMLIEPWAIKMMSEMMEKKLNEIEDEDFKKTKKNILKENPIGWQRLTLLDALMALKKPSCFQEGF